METTIQYVLFDLDGTVTDPGIGITKSAAYALQHFGIEVENLETLYKFIGPPLQQSFMKFYSFSEDQAVTAVEKYRDYYSVTGIYENSLYDGMTELLQKLKAAGKTIILATSKPTVFATKILEYFNLTKYFDFIAGSELDGTRVDKAEIIAFALNECGVTDLSRAVMVGDRMHDIIGAASVGIASIGVCYGYGGRMELENAGAGYIADTVTDLASQIL